MATACKRKPFAKFNWHRYKYPFHGPFVWLVGYLKHNITLYVYRWLRKEYIVKKQYTYRWNIKTNNPCIMYAYTATRYMLSPSRHNTKYTITVAYVIIMHVRKMLNAVYQTGDDIYRYFCNLCIIYIFTLFAWLNTCCSLAQWKHYFIIYILSDANTVMLCQRKLAIYVLNDKDFCERQHSINMIVNVCRLCNWKNKTKSECCW